MILVDSITGRSTNGGVNVDGTASMVFEDVLYLLDYSAGGIVTVDLTNRVLHSVTVAMRPATEEARSVANPRLAMRVYRKVGGLWQQTPVGQTDVYAKPAWSSGSVSFSAPVEVTFYFSVPIVLTAGETYGFFVDPSDSDGAYRIAACAKGLGFDAAQGASILDGLVVRGRNFRDPTQPDYVYTTDLSNSYPMIRVNVDMSERRIYDAINPAGSSYVGGWLIEGNRTVVNDLGQTVPEEASLGTMVTLSATQYVLSRVEAMFSPRNAAALANQHPQFVLKVYRREKHYIPETNRYYMAWGVVAQSSVYTKDDWTALVVPKVLTFTLATPLVLVANEVYYIQIHLYDSIQVNMTGAPTGVVYTSTGGVSGDTYYVYGAVNQVTDVPPQLRYLFNNYGGVNYPSMALIAYAFAAPSGDVAVPEIPTVPNEEEDTTPTAADTAPAVDPWNPPIVIPAPFIPSPLPPPMPPPVVIAGTPYTVQPVPPPALPTDNLGKTLGVYEIDPECQAVTCCGDDEPVANYSADHVERDTFVALAFFKDPTKPENPACVIPAVTTVSDEYSRVIATFNSKLCAWDQIPRDPGGGGGDPGGDGGGSIDPGDTPAQMQCSDEQWCEVPCLTGGTYHHKVAARAVCELAKAQANLIAQSICRLQAEEQKFCIGTPPCGCRNQPYEWQIEIISSAGTADARVREATGLPPGLVGMGTLIVGIPTTSGVFDAHIEMVDPSGNWSERNVRIQILEVTDAPTLAAAEVGEFYNHVFQCSGCGYGENRWRLISGTLPPGMTLTDTGQLYGQLTTAGNYTFEIGIDCE